MKKVIGASLAAAVRSSLARRGAAKREKKEKEIAEPYLLSYLFSQSLVFLKWKQSKNYTVKCQDRVAKGQPKESIRNY